MRKVYEDQDMTMVGYYQTVLEEEGISTAIKNEYAQLAVGEVPFTQVYPELWVHHDTDYDAAVALVRKLRDEQPKEEHTPVNYQRSKGMQRVMWLGTLIVIAILIWGFCSFIQYLVS